MIWVTEYRFKGDKYWLPRGDGHRIDAYVEKPDAEKVIRRETELFAHNTEYRVTEYIPKEHE